MPVGLEPILKDSTSPLFHSYPVTENGNITFELPGIELDGQLLIGRIVKFPAHGTLYNIHPNGSVADPIAKTSTHDSEAVIAQWVHRVLNYSSEWGSTSSYVQYLNMSEADVSQANFNVTVVRCLDLSLVC